MALQRRKAKPRGPKPRPTPKELLPSSDVELLMLPAVMARTRLSDTTIWRLERARRFPARIKIGFRRVAWRKADIDAWICGKAAAGTYEHGPLAGG